MHCDRCGRCVKPTWSHCVECDRCALRQHPCHQFRQAAAAKRRAQTAEAPAEEPNHRPQVRCSNLSIDGASGASGRGLRAARGASRKRFNGCGTSIESRPAECGVFFMEQVLEQPAEDWNRQAAEPEPEPDGSQRRAVELEQQQPQKLRRKVEEKVGPLEREAEKAKATTRWRVTNK